MNQIIEKMDIFDIVRTKTHKQIKNSQMTPFFTYFSSSNQWEL